MCVTAVVALSRTVNSLVCTALCRQDLRTPVVWSQVYFAAQRSPTVKEQEESRCSWTALKDLILCCLQWKVLMSRDSDSCVRAGRCVWSRQADPCPSTSMWTMRRWNHYYWSAADVSFEIMPHINWTEIITFRRNNYSDIQKNNTIPFMEIDSIVLTPVLWVRIFFFQSFHQGSSQVHSPPTCLFLHHFILIRLFFRNHFCSYHVNLSINK